MLVIGIFITLKEKIPLLRGNVAAFKLFTNYACIDDFFAFLMDFFAFIVA